MKLLSAVLGSRSLAWRIQLLLGLVLAAVIALGTFVSYNYSVRSLRAEVLSALRSGTETRAKYESAPFLQAEVNNAALRAEFLHRLNPAADAAHAAITAAAVDKVFDRLLTRFPDGLWRVRPELDDHQRLPTVYIRPSVEITPQIRRRVVVAYQVLSEWGPVLTQNYYSAYIDLPGIGLIMFSPSVNWGKEADAASNNEDYPPVQMSAPAKNPQRKNAWTAIYFDDKAKIWMLSSSLPVDQGKAWIAAASQDISVDDLVKRTTQQVAPGTYNMIIDGQGALVAHPQMMEKINQSAGTLHIAAIGDPLLAGFAKAVAQPGASTAGLDKTTSAAGAQIVESPDGGHYLAVSPIQGPNWFFVTVYPKALLHARAYEATQDIILVGVVALLLEWLALSWIIRRQVSEPLARLKKSAAEIADGKLSATPQLDGQDELGQLAAGFADMAKRLGERGQTLQKHTLALEHEIAERKASEQRMTHMATHDALTGLANRTLLADRMQQAISLAARSRDQVALLFIDLDNFKHINDTLGHEVGDQVLKQVAGKISRLRRKSDTLCRLGGDEFVLLLPSISRQEDAVLVARNIIASLTDVMGIDGLNFSLTPSIGIATYPADGLEVGELMRNADIAMYRAKATGKNGYQCYTADMGLRAGEALHLEGAIRQAIEQNELELYFQPKVDASNFQVAGAEALLRWQRPGFGLLSPAEFVPFAEKHRLIGDIDRYVLKKACQHLADWRDAGCKRVPIAVNMSASHFARAGLLQETQALLALHQIEPAWLTLEITEGVLLQDAEVVASNLVALRQLGLRISIDDFGTGFSSLSYMHRFAVDEIKIDRSFVAAIQSPSDDVPLIRAIVRMAKDLQMAVVAEGVETPVQAALLKAHGCDELQGYHFFRPMDQAAFTELLGRA